MLDLTRQELIKIEPVVASTIVAVVGWVITHFHKWYFDNNADKLDRVNKQLRKLYGSLYASLMASHSTWKAYLKRHRPAHGGNRYCGMSNIIEPLNSETEKLILKNIDLLDSREISKVFIDALAYNAA